MRRPGRYLKMRFFLILTVVATISLVFFVKKRSTRSFFSSNFASPFSLDAWPTIRVVSGRDSSNSRATTTETGFKKAKNAPQGCRLAKLLVDDPEISHMFKSVDPLKCKEEKNWIRVENNSFLVEPSAAAKHGAITCSYTKLWRLSDFKTASKKIDNYKNGSAILSDFFKAECTAVDGATYKNVHATVVRDDQVLKRVTEASKGSKEGTKKALKLNVYIIGFDSLSRMTFMRKMRKTYEYLTKTLGAVVLEGYNIVGDGTPQALIPILTGKTEIELPNTRRRYANASFVNVYPFVWDEFSDAGYATLYGEDSAAFGTFTYRLKGFDKQPTDHYMRTFYTVADPESMKHPRHCWGSEPHHKVHFDYPLSFFRNYPSEMRKFAFQFHSMLSHDDINLVQVADEYMTDYLKTFQESGYLNDTMLIFMSDHGHRFSALRETQQGKLEERLPMFAVVLPTWFAKSFPDAAKNLRINAERLTTPFDIHPTLQSILDFKYPPRKADEVGGHRGISLFDEIPATRTCADAGVETHWCACMSWSSLPVVDERVQYIARALVDAINGETAAERSNCAKLTLKSVEKAWRHAPNDELMHYVKSKDKDGFIPDLSGTTEVKVEYFQLNVRTTPGDALYEASVTLDRRVNELVLNLDDVSHINKYGDLPHCIIDKDYFLAKWCVCYDKI